MWEVGEGSWSEAGGQGAGRRREVHREVGGGNEGWGGEGEEGEWSMGRRRVVNVRFLLLIVLLISTFSPKTSRD